MKKFVEVSVIELKEDKQLSALVPEMTGSEYERFIESVKQSGIQTPVHIRNDMTILDGRHRVRACKELGIIKIEALVHNISKDESVAFVRDTAVERRNLTAAQRIDIVLRSEELINSLTDKAKKKLSEFTGNQYKKVDLSPAGERTKINTNKDLAKLADSSMNQVLRMKKIKKEDPKSYEQVVKGERTVYNAYQSLPSVTPDKPRSEYPSRQKVVPLVIPEPEPMTPDETKMLIAVENLDLNFNQIIHFVAENQEKMYDAICQVYEERPEFMEQAHQSFVQLVSLMDAYQGGKKHEKKI